MKLFHKALLIVLLFALLFLLSFKLVLFKRVVNTLTASAEEINFILHKLNVKIVNITLPHLPPESKYKILISQEHIFKHHFHIIVNDKGQMITLQNGKLSPSFTLKEAFPHVVPFFKKFLKSGKRVMKTEDALRRVLYFFKIDGLGTLIIETSKNDLKELLFKNLNPIVITNISIIFLFFISIGLFLLFIIYREINTLHKGTVEIKKGNLKFKFKEKGSKEFVEIYQTINQITDELEKNIKELEQYFEVAEAIMLVLDKEGKIAKINKKGAEVLGADREQILGMDWFENFIPEKDREKIREVFKKILKRELDDVKYFENPVITSKGERLISWHNSLLENEKGEITGVLSSGYDITDIKKLEEEQLKIIKFESLKLLTGGIAHDFNNLLTSISMNVEIAKLSKDRKKTDEVLARIEKVVERAKFLTDQLLTFSKGGEPIIEEHSIEEIIKETVDFILAGSSIKIKFNIPENLWHVEIDKRQISQVIQNIVLNAKEAIPDSGEITISCENKIFKKGEIKPPGLTKDKYVVITISDTGIGIPKKYLSKIFDPYFTTKKKGSGLGLSISFSIVKKHKGHIEVESEEGKGTTFKIYLPAADQPLKKETHSSSKTSKKAKSLKILVFDDQKEIVENLKEIFELLGHTLIPAENSKKVLEIYQKEKIDLVILDLTIPGDIGGKELAQEIFKLDKNAKIVLTSGYTTDPVVVNYRDYGFMGVITKPFKVEDIKRLLEKV